MPTTEEGIETPTNANAEIADGATAIDETEDEAWLQEEHETLEERYRRYVRRYVQCEVSGPDEWADILMELLAQCVQGQGQGKEQHPRLRLIDLPQERCRNLWLHNETDVLQMKQQKRWCNVPKLKVNAMVFDKSYHLQDLDQDLFLQVTTRTTFKILWGWQATMALVWFQESMQHLKSTYGIR